MKHFIYSKYFRSRKNSAFISISHSSYKILSFEFLLSSYQAYIDLITFTCMVQRPFGRRLEICRLNMFSKYMREGVYVQHATTLNTVPRFISPVQTSVHNWVLYTILHLDGKQTNHVFSHSIQKRINRKTALQFSSF